MKYTKKHKAGGRFKKTNKSRKSKKGGRIKRKGGNFLKTIGNVLGTVAPFAAALL